MNWAELFNYDSETGNLIWKIRPSQNVRVGAIVGSVHHTGYRIVRFSRKNYLAHRIVWDLNNPDDKLQPGDEIDHIDHDKLNNRLSSLRKVSAVENSRNKPLATRNTSGTSGVYWYSQYGKWRAQIVVKGRLVFLGYFADKEDAILARRAAEIKYGFHKNHGKSS